MAPIVIVAPTIVRFTFKHTVRNSRPADVIQDISVDESGSSRHDAVAAVVGALQDAWQDSFVGGFTTGVQYIGCHWIDLDTVGGTSGDLGFNPAKNHAGTWSGNELPPNVAHLVHKSAGATRGTRNGRSYLPGVAENNVNDDGTIVSAKITDINSACSTFKSHVSSAGGIIPPTTTAWRVVHVVGHDGVPAPGYPNGKPNAWNSTDVLTAFADSRVATMRRRNRK